MLPFYSVSSLREAEAYEEIYKMVLPFSYQFNLFLKDIKST